MYSKSTLFLNIILCLLCIPLAGCGSHVKKIDYNAAREIPEDAAPAPIMFRKAEFLIPPGQEIGYSSNSSTYCGWPKSPINRGALTNAIEQKYLKENFKNALESAGYDVVSSISHIVEEEIDDELRAEYTINAKIKATQVNLCENSSLNIFSASGGTEGEVYISVDWSVYDPVKRAVTYKTTTEGYAKLPRPNQDGLTLLLHDAFEMATHNLGTDEQFHNLIVNGLKPDNWKKSGLKNKQNNFESRHIFDPLEDVTIHQSGLSKQSFTNNIERKRQNVVVVQKIGHGSGFFISKQGHLITNAHVVGDSIKTGIVLANKKKRIAVEVLRIDKLRDVALLKIEDLNELPDNYEIQIAPMRTQIPGIGEDVYALGTPLHYSKMQDTLSKGIVSAYRKNYTLNLTKQSYIQSDINIHKGSSGGPLYDTNGNITGITVLGYGTDAQGTGNSLNLFIPIAEALEKLNINIESD